MWLQGEQATVHTLAETISEAVGYTGKITYDTGKPAGQRERVFDVQRIRLDRLEPRAHPRDWRQANRRLVSLPPRDFKSDECSEGVSHAMADFQLVSPHTPAGDQPTAIVELREGLTRCDPAQVLLGATGTGKTFSIAHVIADHGRPTLVMSHNKDTRLAALW